MLFNTGKNTLHRHMDLMADAIINHKCAVRILISDPNSVVWQTDEIAEVICPGTDVPSEVRDIERYMKRLAEKIENRPQRPKGGSIEMRQYRSAPTGSIILVDGEFAQYTPYLPYFHSSEVPIYEMERGHGNGQLMNVLSETFERVWAQAKPAFKKTYTGS